MPPHGADDVDVAEANDCRRYDEDVYRHGGEVGLALPPRCVTFTGARIHVLDRIHGKIARYRCRNEVSVGQHTRLVDSDGGLPEDEHLCTR